jgi:putative ABC transport system permease protein
MRAKKILEMAVSNLKQRKLRTALTTLGVIVGITTIIGLASLGEGFRTDIKTRMQAGFELNNLVVFPGSFTAGFGEPFEQTDLNNIRNVSNVELATGMRTLAEVQVYNASDARLRAVTVAGINFTEMQQMLPERFRLAAGTFPSDNDTGSIVLGYTAATSNETRSINIGDNVTLVITLHPSPTISYNINETLTVSGILEEGGTSGITNFDYWAFIPMSKATAIEFGRESYQIILVKVTDAQQESQTATNIENTFDNPYRVTVFVPSSFMQQVDNILNIIQIFLLAVASISLIVAGIGIMNIMTVSVMERTREVGILKAIGAKSRTVLTMFLTEAAIIGIAGGLIGILIGYGTSYGLASLLSNFIQPQQTTLFSTPGTQALSITPIFTPQWTIAAFIFAVTVCIVFGLYPARKASKLNPVEALHYE